VVFERAGALFYAQRSTAPAMPLKPFQIYCCFSRRSVFFKLQLIGSGSAPLLFLERVYVFCLEMSITLSTLSDEGRTILGKSSAMYLPPKVRGRLCWHPDYKKFSLRNEA